MLYLFYGSDVSTAGLKARALVASLQTKRPEATLIKIEADNWDEALLRSQLGGQGLFSSKYIVWLDRVSEKTEAKEALAELAPLMRDSENIFVMLEGKLLAALKKSLEGAATKTVVCDEKKAAPAEDSFAAFAIANALARGDNFKAWQAYRQAVDAGTASENIIGILFWKAKTLGAKSLARDLVTLYHEGHRGRRDLELATEKLLLNCAKP